MYDIAIVVPVYKVPYDYLKKCIESLLQQTLNNVQIILVDDGSPDKCGDICDEYKKDRSNITVIHNRNNGVSNARNEGIKVVNAKYVMFVDGDDYLNSDTCEIVLSKAEENDCDILCFNTYLDYPNDKIVVKKNCEENVILMGEQVNQLKCELLQSVRLKTSLVPNITTLVYVWGKLYKTECIRNISFPEKIQQGEDRIYTYFLLNEKCRLGYIPNTLYHYRLQNDSVTHNFYNNHVDNTLNVVKYIVSNDEDILQNERKKEAFNIFVISNINLLLDLYFLNSMNGNTRKERLTEFVKFVNSETISLHVKGLAFHTIKKLPNYMRILSMLLKLKLYQLIFLYKERGK